MSKKSIFKKWYFWVIISIIIIFLIAIFSIILSEPIKCKLKGGEWWTLGPMVGCCADEEYWIQQKLSCEESGGEWILPEFIGATIKDGFCFCPSPKEWICPIGYPCAICRCELFGIKDLQHLGDGMWKQTDMDCDSNMLYTCQRMCYDEHSVLWENCAKQLSDKIEKIDEKPMICSPYGGILDENDCGNVMMWKTI